MGNRSRFLLFNMASRSWLSKLKNMVVKPHRSQPLNLKNSTPIQSPAQQEEILLPRKRASQYIPSQERKEKPPPARPRCPVNTKASDTHFPAAADLPSPRKSKRRPRKVAGKPPSRPAAAASSCEPEAEAPELTDQLPPIRTKKKAANDDESETPGRRSASVSGAGRRIKVRRSSPRVAESKKPAAMQKKREKTVGLSESLVMMKSSSNPWRDFADSMLEMIVENDIREAKDLEELLACYLSLNSKEYHGVIIKVFEHIWFALTDR